MTDISNKKELYEKYDKLIDDLYTYRDKFYILNENVTNADDRNQALLKRVEDIAQELEQMNNEKTESKANYCVLAGKAFNGWCSQMLLQLYYHSSRSNTIVLPLFKK